MLRQTQNRRISTTFRGYFSHQAMNRLVKKLLVVIPNLPALANRANKSLEKIIAPLLNKVLNNNNTLRGKISMINLSDLNDTLALHLRKSSNRILRLNPEKITFEKIDLQDVLQKQSQMLRELIQTQKESLKEQSKTMLKEQLEVRQKRQSKIRNKNKK